MKHMMMITILMLSLNAGLAFAQIDPDPNGMSIYFDLGAEVTCFYTNGAMAPVTAYLILTNPTADFINGWDCGVVSNIDAYHPGEWIIEIGTNLLEPPYFSVSCDVDPVGMEGSTVVLARRPMLFLGMPSDFASFCMSARPGSILFPDNPGYLDGDDVPIECSPIWGGWGDVAWINGWCWWSKNPCFTVPNETMTWGQMKALY